jgi:hypothetical protein
MSRVAIPLQALHIGTKVGSVLVAHVAIFLERLGDDPLQLRRKRRVQSEGRLGRAVEMASKITAEVLPAKGCRPVAIS